MRGRKAAEGDEGQARQHTLPEPHVPGQDQTQHLCHRGCHRGETGPSLDPSLCGGRHLRTSVTLPSFQALCSLLRRDASVNFKAKGNSLVSVLACNLLMAAYEEDENWPEIFVKVRHLPRVPGSRALRNGGCRRPGQERDTKGGSQCAILPPWALTKASCMPAVGTHPASGRLQT